MRNTGDSILKLIRFSLLTVVLYFSAQTVIVILHEYAHSTTAWLLGCTQTFRTVIWGNPLTITGWDEGVPYDQVFRSAGHPAEAAIGGMPLLMHAVFTILGLYWLQRRLSAQHPLRGYAVYLFVVVNLTELVAYLAMRPFAGSGDTGRFNEGFGLSPWPLFVVSNVLLVWALAVLLLRVTPKLAQLLELDKKKRWITVSFTAFMMFLGGSGLRIMALYPDRQWKWGLIGIPAFLGWILLSQRQIMRAATRSISHS
jgi:hypothetical protein